jgi:hypothetical protein
VSEVGSLLHLLAEASQKNLQQEMADREALDTLRQVAENVTIARKRTVHPNPPPWCQELRESSHGGDPERTRLDGITPNDSFPGSLLNTPGLGPQDAFHLSPHITPAASDTQEVEDKVDSILPSALKSWSELKTTILEHKRFAVFINFEGTLVDYVGEGDFDPG